MYFYYNVCSVLGILFHCVILCILFHCALLCIVCVYMCTVLRVLPPAVNPIAVNKIYHNNYGSAAVSGRTALWSI